MRAKQVAVVGVAAALLLAGCLVPVPGVLAPSATGDEPADRPDWRADDWWSFRVEVPDGGHASSTFVVHEAEPDGYHLGSNRSNGFFGIPFHGEVDRDLNPKVAGERWDMFRFPLEDGDSWTQRFLGHLVTTHVEAAQVPGPDGAVDGYRLTAEAYGAPVATYTYASETGWLTSFTLRDPEDGSTLAWANLTEQGAGYDGRYLVEEPVHRLERTYPGELPGEERFQVHADGIQLVATLTASARPGHVDARLEAPDGDVVAEVATTGQAMDNHRRTWPVEEGNWRLEHRGVGAGQVRAELHVVRAAGPGAGDAGQAEAGPAAGGPLDHSLADLLGAGDPT